MKIISILAKCSDRCSTSIKEDSNVILDIEGYAPKIGGVCNGDYIKLDIDIETGKVLNFNKEDIGKFILENVNFNGEDQ